MVGAGGTNEIAELSLVKSTEIDGYAITERVLSLELVDHLLAVLGQINDGGSTRKRSEIFAVRNLLSVPEIMKLAESDEVRGLVEPVLGAHCFPVRGILFDKVPDANWKVPWHQDVTIAVQEKVEVDGFGPWSVKAGVLHVQPPAEILEQMLSVRFHLDECGEENGALRVIAGSHRFGRIGEDAISTFRETMPEQVCAVGLGGALLMRPLLLHASSPSRVPGHRRVIHLDFAAVELPGGMQWMPSKAVA